MTHSGLGTDVEFEDIVRGEIEGASAPSATTVYEVEVHRIGSEDPVMVVGELAFDSDTDDLMIYGDGGAYTSFNWQYVEYYVARPVR